MQSSSSSATNINHEQTTPYQVNVFLFGHEETDSPDVRRFSKYAYRSHQHQFDLDDDSDDDDHLILSGRFFSSSVHTSSSTVSLD